MESGLLRGLDRFVQRLLYVLCVVLFIALGLILLTNVFMRMANDLSIFLDMRGMGVAASFVKSMVPIASMHWFDEIVELCFAALVFYGAAALWGVKGHFSVGDWISPRLPGVYSRAVYKLIVSLLSLTFIAVFFWFSLALTRRTTELSTVFQIPKSVMYSCMPISSFIMMMYSLGDVCKDLRQLFAPSREGGSSVQQSQSM